ncbi:MAG: hypothetical protein IKU17_05370 [Clostridia bacterium]|nr:hypothetical protein [Clostridia bacterium]
MKKTVRCILICAVLMAALLAVSGCQKKQAETVLQPPVKGLTWGMTQEEALKALYLEAEDVPYTNSSGSVLGLNYALAGMGAELNGMKLTQENQAVQLRFEEYEGVQRLSGVTLYVYAKSGAALKEAMTLAYGEPYEGEQTLWSGTDLQKDAVDADVEKLNEQDLQVALQIADGEQKLFALRPFVTVYTNTDLPALKLNQPYDFLLMYHADAYLKSLYGSAAEETAVSLAKPIGGLHMGMSRTSFAQLIGTTEEELLAKNKREILLDYTALGMTEPEFLGFALCSDETGAPRQMRISFAENGNVAILQVIVLADSLEELKSRLTALYGEPTAYSMPQWYDVNSTDETMQPFITYVDNGAVNDGQRVFTLFVNANFRMGIG